MYLNHPLNPGSLSYLPTNGPVVRRSTPQCHSSVKPWSDEQVRLLHIRKAKSDSTHTGGIAQSSEISFVNLTSIYVSQCWIHTKWCVFIFFYWQSINCINNSSPPGMVLLLCWSLRILNLFYCVAFVINLPREEPVKYIFKTVSKHAVLRHSL